MVAQQGSGAFSNSGTLSDLSPRSAWESTQSRSYAERRNEKASLPQQLAFDFLDSFVHIKRK